MKTKSLLIAALFVVGSFINSIAGDEPVSKGLAVLKTASEGIFKVIYKSEVASRIKLSLFDAESKLVYSESFSSDGFILPLNFQGLSYGEYTLEVTGASGRKTERISYQAPVDSKYFSVRKVENTTNKFVVAVSGVNKTEQINVKIYDALNNLVHTDVKEVTGQFSRVYILKNASGAVTFEISDNNGKSNVVTF